MFTFVVWAIGLMIMFSLAMLNVGIIKGCFSERHPTIGLGVTCLSVVGWTVLLIAIFG